MCSYRLCMYVVAGLGVVFFFKQKTAYEMRISDWSSDVCSSDLLDLNDLVVGADGWTFDFAWDINDQGWIVGNATDAQGNLHAFLLTPVPEPGVLEIGRASCRERVCQYV